MSEQKTEGGCQCGAIRYSISGEPLMTGICHCTICRRAHAAPAVAWAMYQEGQVPFSNEKLKSFASSLEGKRHFCEVCGTQISFTASFIPGIMVIALGSLDNPESVKPTFHFWHSKHLTWAEFADALPRYPELPPS